MCVHICIYTYIIHTCMYTCIHTCNSACTHLYIHTYIHTHTYIYIPPKKYIHKICKHLIIRENFSTSGAITNQKEYLAR